ELPRLNQLVFHHSMKAYIGGVLRRHGRRVGDPPGMTSKACCDPYSKFMYFTTIFSKATLPFLSEASGPVGGLGHPILLSATVRLIPRGARDMRTAAGRAA
ncbi:MAG TPA: hypothetical protein VFO59_01865, partial [Dehalococcoidia bacterium]|nr:hypothetical protein [Dehalococcoidia bacterium]